MNIRYTFPTICFILFLLAATIVNAQGLYLDPSIGIGALPSDNEAICPIPIYTGDYYATGLQAGDTAANFTLYDLNGDSINLRSALQTGKPVLMITGSYTCPVFRGKIPLINDIVQTYGNDLTTFIVYTVEAHPTDTSPYFGFINITQANINEGILYDQPTTYGEKKAIVSDLLNDITIDAPVLIDGPCNNWWLHYGPAPQNAYIIDTTGKVFVKHGWFNKYPDDIICDIDSLLGNPSNCGGAADGSFEFILASADTLYGAPGKTLYGSGLLINNSTSDVLIDVRRLQNNMAPDWESSMCLDACLSPDVDTTTLFLAPGDTQLYTMYFFSGDNIDTSSIRMGFRNQNDNQNFFVQWFHGITDSSYIDTTGNPPDTTTGMIAENSIAHQDIRVYPNPFTTTTTIYVPEALMTAPIELTVYDLNGKLLRHQIMNHTIHMLDREGLSKGMYIYRVKRQEEMIGQGKMIVY